MKLEATFDTEKAEGDTEGPTLGELADLQSETAKEVQG